MMQPQPLISKPLVTPTIDYFSTYRNLVGQQEASPILYRWAAIMSCSVLATRRVWIQFGPKKIFPNLYVMFVGEAASRKSTVIDFTRDRLQTFGYSRFAPEETSKEKYAMHLAGVKSLKEITGGESLAEVMEPEKFRAKINHSFICAGEFANFIGYGNFGFASFLGDIWDRQQQHVVGYKNSGSFTIWNPLVNVLAGNTFEGLMESLPPKMLGQGFLSRVIFVHAPSVKTRITFPSEPGTPDLVDLGHYFTFFSTVAGEIKIAPEARKIIESIYMSWRPLPDSRFKAYSGRRLMQMLKLTMVEAMARGSLEINIRDVIRANTFLSFTEYYMPQALGEYGSNRNALGANTVMQIMYNNPNSFFKIDTLWRVCSSGFDSLQGFQATIAGLLNAGKIKPQGGSISLARGKLVQSDFINYNAIPEIKAFLSERRNEFAD